MANNFVNLIIQGSQSAIRSAQTLITTPTLIFIPDEGAGSKGWAVPLEVEQHQQNINIEVSENPVITQDRKINVMDNIAPGSWEWNLIGYIGGIPDIELTNIYTPFVTLQTNYLKMAAEKGYLLKFKDSDCHLYENCIIKQLTISEQKDAKNKKPFSLVLKQINVIDPANAELSESEQFATMASKSILGATGEMGVTIATNATIEALSALF